MKKGIKIFRPHSTILHNTKDDVAAADFRRFSSRVTRQPGRYISKNWRRQDNRLTYHNLATTEYRRLVESANCYRDAVHHPTFRDDKIIHEKNPTEPACIPV